MKKTILITGINGFLGSHIAKRLSKSFNIIGIEYSLNNLFRIAEFPFKLYDSKLESIKTAFQENSVDVIIHTATLYGRNNESLSQIAETNLFMPFNLLDLSIKNGVSTFINTDTVLDRFVNSYALTKKQLLDWLIFRKEEIKVINMQLEHFYGPGCSNNFISTMIEKLKKHQPIDLTLGEQKRDFVYYEDIIDAFELVVNKMDTLTDNFNNFEVGTGITFSIKEIVTMLKEATKSNSQLNFGAIPYRTNELMESHADISNILKLGWTPKTDIKTGILKTI